MRGDLKAQIIAHWERYGALKPSYAAVAKALDADHDYVALVLRLHRGQEDWRQALPSREVHDLHVEAVARANMGRGFPFYPSDAWSRP